MSKRKSSCIETASVEIVKRQLLKYGIELRAWQAGTESDFGIRPVGSTADKWLPYQAKTTLATRKPFKFFFRHSYEIDILGIPGNRAGAYCYSTEFMKKNFQHLVGGKYISVSAGQVWNQSLKRWPELAEYLRLQWSSRHDDLKSEMDLRMQCTKNSQMEICTQMLMMKMFSHHRHGWPANAQDTYDRLRNEQRIQDKVVGHVNFHFVAKLTKKISGKQVPYEEGDADFFVCCTVHEKLRLLFVWEFSNAELVQQGILKTKTQDGKTSTSLYLNAELHVNVFGKEAIDQQHWTIKHLNVFPLPTEFVVPDCLCGRDPIVR
jgi:hypothetical protein